jgi:hypothetical protein
MRDDADQSHSPRPDQRAGRRGSEDPRLARFSAAIDGDGRLTLYRDRVPAAEGRLDQVGGLAGIESALSQHFEGETIGGNLYLEGVTAWQELGGS